MESLQIPMIWRMLQVVVESSWTILNLLQSGRLNWGVNRDEAANGNGMDAKRNEREWI